MIRLRTIPLVALLLVPLGCARQAEVEVAQEAQVAPAPAQPPAPRPQPRLDPAEKIITTTVEKTEELPKENLINEDPGLDPKVEAALPEIERLDKQTVESSLTPGAIGKPDAHPLPSGIGLPDDKDDKPMVLAFPGRTGATKSKLLKEGGGNAESERAVALGLAWLARQQKQDGGWEYDQGQKECRAAATGMALLPFLAAGHTHKPLKEKGAEKDYSKTVSAGLGYLMKACPTSGPNAGRISTNMYEQAIGTLALCEAYGMTKDPVFRPYAQAAINFIQRSQGPDGSWGYSPGNNGDTSIVGWQIQAIHAARLSKDLVVDDRVIKKAVQFLDHAAAGARKSMYGYKDAEGAKPGTALTASGLLSRYCINGWSQAHPGMADGVAGLMKNPPAGKGEIKNLYYLYYATQVVHFSEGEEWKNWNEGPKGADGKRTGGMRDWLVNAQIKKEGADQGSWDPEAGFFGKSCGRLGTTAMCVLSLEVYYRHLPLYKRGQPRDTADLKDK